MFHTESHKTPCFNNIVRIWNFIMQHCTNVTNVAPILCKMADDICPESNESHATLHSIHPLWIRCGFCRAYMPRPNIVDLTQSPSSQRLLPTRSHAVPAPAILTPADPSIGQRGTNIGKLFTAFDSAVQTRLTSIEETKKSKLVTLTMVQLSLWAGKYISMLVIGISCTKYSIINNIYRYNIQTCLFDDISRVPYIWTTPIFGPSFAYTVYFLQFLISIYRKIQLI